MLVGNDRLIIIDGMAHSGTTIFTYTLKQHYNIVCGIEGSEAWIFENPWLLAEQTQPIQDLLYQFPTKRVLLKRPWASVNHSEWMLREMPNAKYIYCQRNLEDMCASWSKPTSFVCDSLRSGGRDHQVEFYNNALQKGLEFGQKATFFKKVFFPDFVAEPKKIMDEMLLWLNLPPMKFNISMVSPGGDIKSLLWSRNFRNTVRVTRPALRK